MKNIITIIFLFITAYCISQNDTIHDFKRDNIKVTRIPHANPVINSPKVPQPPPLNGPYKLYNKKGQVAKDGIFKDNRFLDGKSYKYDGDGKLIRIEIYKDGVYIGDEK
jgi:hypothetical protein